jgi:hypothetical protein
MTEPEQDAVTALQFTDLTIADDLAGWCSGEVTKRVDIDGPDAERTVILVPTAKGPKAAHLGDWIVRRAEGDFYPCQPDEFALLHEPVE